LRNRYAEIGDNRHRRSDHAAEALEIKVLRACETYPWTPSEIVDWQWSWLHMLAYGPEASTRPHQPFYGRVRRGDSVTWALKFPDIEAIVETLDEEDKRRYRSIS
jgi:hypothetical protein